MADKTFAAFFSYVHDDDTHDNGRITKLRQMLEEEVRALSGEDFEIFQDYEDIHWGQKWEERLNGALDGSTLLISVVTPRYIKKEFCRKEVLRFLERESKLGRNDLVLSIYYIDTDLGTSNDPVISAISNHQYYDWRDLRHEPHTNPEVGKRIEKMALEIMAAMKRNTLASLKTIQIAEIISRSSEAFITEITSATEIRQPSKRVEPPTMVVDPMPRRGDYTTITKAIESADPGTRILIRPGFYKEAIKLEKPLELIGDGDRDEIIIEAINSCIIQCQTEFGRIANLTLRQSGGNGFFGIDILQGRIEIDDCDISCKSRSSIAIHNAADPRLRRNRIHNGERSGIYIFENGKGTIENNDVFENEGNGVTIELGSDPIIRYNRIYKNSGSGVEIRNEDTKSTLEENDIFNNETLGIVIYGSDPTIRRNRIHDCRWGIGITENGKGIFEYNEIYGHIKAGAVITEGGNPIMRNNKINKNSGAGIQLYNRGNGTFEYNNLTGNELGAWSIDDESEPIRVINNTEY